MTSDRQRKIKYPYRKDLRWGDELLVAQKIAEEEGEDVSGILRTLVKDALRERGRWPIQKEDD